MKNYAYSFSKASFAMLILIFVSAASAVAQDVAGDVKKALRFLDIEQPTKAIESLNGLVAKYPTDATVLYSLGYAYIKKGELDKANAEFDKGIKLNDKEPINYVGKGYVSLLKNNQADSKVNFDKAQALAKKNAAVLNGIAEAYLSNKTLAAGALDLLTKSKGINSKDAATLILLGDAYLNANDGGKAVSSYEDAALVEPKNGKPHFKVGVVYNRSKNADATLAAYEKAVAVDPEYAPAYKELGEYFYSKSEGAKAVKAQESYLAITENPEPGKMQLAFYKFMAKDYTGANELFEKVLQAPNALAIGWKFYAKSLAEKTEMQKAIGAYENFFTKAKKEEVEAGDYSTYADMLVKMKQKPLDSIATESYKKSLAIDSASAGSQKVLQSLADVLLKRGKCAESIVYYKKLIAKRTQVMSIDNYSIGKAYICNNQLVEADSAFSKLIKLQPAMMIGYSMEAKVKSLQDPEQKAGLAKPYMEKIIEIGQADPVKNKADLLNAYNYLATYSYNVEHDLAKTKSYYEKIIAVNPADKGAQENLDILNKVEKKRAADAAKKPQP